MDYQDISYLNVKAALYIALMLFGISLLVVAYILKNMAATAVDPALCMIPAIILFLAGMTGVFFGIQIFIIRDDPDVWQ